MPTPIVSGALVRVARVALAAVLPPLTAWEVEVFATNSIPLLL
jgi:hypothetical protein